MSINMHVAKFSIIYHVYHERVDVCLGFLYFKLTIKKDWMDDWGFIVVLN